MTFKVGDLIRIKEDHAKKWDIPPGYLINYLIIGRQYGWTPPGWDERGLTDCDKEFFKLLTPENGTCFELVDTACDEMYERVI